MASTLDPSYLSLGTTQDLRSLGMTTMFGVRPGHGLTSDNYVLWQTKAHGSGMVARKRCQSDMVAIIRRRSVNVFRSRRESIKIIRPKFVGSDMIVRSN